MLNHFYICNLFYIVFHASLLMVYKSLPQQYLKLTLSLKLLLLLLNFVL